MSKFVLIKYPPSILGTLQPDTTFPPDAQIGLTQDGKKAAEQIGTNLATGAAAMPRLNDKFLA